MIEGEEIGRVGTIPTRPIIVLSRIIRVCVVTFSYSKATKSFMLGCNLTLRYSLLRRDLLASNKGELVQEIDKLVINVEQGKMDLDTATNILIQYTETCTYRKARELLGGWKRRKLRAALDEYTETPGDGYPNKE